MDPQNLKPETADKNDSLSGLVTRNSLSGLGDRAIASMACTSPDLYLGLRTILVLAAWQQPGTAEQQINLTAAGLLFPSIPVMAACPF